ncbi:MAG: hypothetical protein NC548_27870 [Lachnospiraceae bacterium]|nr:hypothetical protein [Lachnospiraceae bacterium]
MFFCNMDFLKPEDPEELKIWQLMNTYRDTLIQSYDSFSAYDTKVSELLQNQLLEQTSSKSCGNYPLLDDAESDCIWGIHHYTEDDVKDIERSLVRSELEYSGQNVTSTNECNHFDEKLHRQFITDQAVVGKNTAARINDCLIDMYYAYMTRRGMLPRFGENPLVAILSLLRRNELALDHYASTNPDELIRFAIFQSTLYNNAKRVVIMIASESTDLAAKIFDTDDGKRERTRLGVKTQFFTASKEQFDAELSTLRIASNGYTVVSKKYNKVLTLCSLFRFNLMTDTFEEIDPKAHLQTHYVGMYGITKRGMNVMPVKDVYLLNTPGINDDYYGVLCELMPLRCGLEETMQTKILVSNKVEADRFDLVTEDGSPIPIVDGYISWEEVERHEFDHIHCSDEVITKYPDIVSYGKMYNLKITTSVDCYIRISCHVSSAYGSGINECFDKDFKPIVSTTWSHAPNQDPGYEARGNCDLVTPGVSSIFIPFCSNIKEVVMTDDWKTQFHTLNCVLKLYAVYHAGTLSEDAVQKELINYNICGLEVVPETCINHPNAVGWFNQKKGHKNCVALSHQERMYLRIDLKDPIWVYGCMGFQLHLNDNVMRLTSNVGCSFNKAQDIEFHVQTIPTPCNDHDDPRVQMRYNVMTMREHHPDDIIIHEMYDDISENKKDIRIDTEWVKHETLASTYTFRIKASVRSTGEEITFLPFRSYRGTDRLQVFYKKQQLLNNPVECAPCSDLRFDDDRKCIEFDVNLDDIEDTLTEYNIYGFIPYVIGVFGNKNVLINWIDAVFDMSKVKQQ